MALGRHLCHITFTAKHVGMSDLESNALHGHMVFLDVKKVPLDEDVGAIEHQYGCIGTRTVSIDFTMKVTRQYQFAKNVLEKLVLDNPSTVAVPSIEIDVACQCSIQSKVTERDQEVYEAHLNDPISEDKLRLVQKD
ncbi:hypothetical protein BCV71DRAFT_234481 [Rhizopus microsporus]|uniref:Uncharacterized protein n=1 Tax=Rhizopus microsporus TaxID=58291 RepID=A0A1X0S3Z9_RHIZD|nr:hypothetical protein BCV71DRAFT_234481 [Rhizopus microsporus]